MADISSINLNDIVYNIKDEQARNNINSITTNYLPLTGGTLTGQIDVKNTSIDSTTTPSKTQYLTMVRGIDKNNITNSTIRMYYSTNGNDALQLMAHRVVNNADIYNSLYIGIDSAGNPYFYTDYPSEFRNAINAVNKSGDTMTGGLVIAPGRNYDGVDIEGASGAPHIHLFNTGNTAVIDIYKNGSSGGERYYFPTPDTRSSDAWIPVLTGKTPVTKEQGGTGGTDSGIVNCTLSSGITGTLTVRKIGVFVELYCEVHVTNGLAATGNTYIGVIPSGYRPPADRRLPCGDGGRFGCLYVTPNGNMRFYNDQVNAITGSSFVACHTFYLV